MLLSNSIDSLLDDVDQIRELVENISQDLPDDLKATLESATHLEDHFPAVRRALKNTASMSNLLNIRASKLQKIKDLHSRIQFSKNSYEQMQTDLDAMKLKRPDLEAQLSLLNSQIQDQEAKVAGLPDIIDQAKGEIQAHIKEDISLKARLQKVQKSSDNDQKVLDNFHQIKTEAINAIKLHLNL